MTVWTSLVPDKCQLCFRKITDKFIDGKVAVSRVWAIMCFGCHEIHGVGFGVGKGQKYVKKDELFEKVEG